MVTLHLVPTLPRGNAYLTLCVTNIQNTLEFLEIEKSRDFQSLRDLGSLGRRLDALRQ